MSLMSAVGLSASGKAVRRPRRKDGTRRARAFPPLFGISSRQHGGQANPQDDVPVKIRLSALEWLDMGVCCNLRGLLSAANGMGRQLGRVGGRGCRGAR